MKSVSVFHLSPQLVQQLAQGWEHHQGDAEIANTVGNIKRNAGDPFGDGIGHTANEDIHDTAQGTEAQAVDAGKHGPGEGALTVPHQNSRKSQDRPNIEVVDIPQSDAVKQHFHHHENIYTVQALPAENCRIQHGKQGHRLNIGQRCHNYLQGKGQGSQDPKEDRLIQA